MFQIFVPILYFPQNTVDVIFENSTYEKTEHGNYSLATASSLFTSNSSTGYQIGYPGSLC